MTIEKKVEKIDISRKEKDISAVENEVENDSSVSCGTSAQVLSSYSTHFRTHLYDWWRKLGAYLT